MRYLRIARAVAVGLYETVIETFLMIGDALDGPPAAPRNFCPRCSKRLHYIAESSLWRCDANVPHIFYPGDHRIARFDVPR